ncbi:MAG: enoyl-CoA hydratase-related protein [Alphaproteobacteria bacterium]
MAKASKSYRWIKLERDGGVAILTLNDPATLNAIQPAMMREIEDALRRIDDDDLARAIVITGAGRGFCSGQNLRSVDDIKGGLGVVRNAMREYFPVFRAIRRARAPVIAAVNGVAAGGGFSLALAADFIVAARSALFIQVFSRIGLIPDVGSSFFLPRLIGRARALGVMMTNQPITADKAKEWGIIWDCVDDERMMNEAMALARKLAAGPTQTYALTRKVVDESHHHDLERQFEYELEIQSHILETADAREGITAFLEKRPAKFQGA